MALPTTPSSWIEQFSLPNRLFETGRGDYELYEGDQQGHRRTDHRRFRFPKQVAEDDIVAEYTNGVLKVRLPIGGTTVSGREIEIQ